jgi:integrase/recombinase XerD
VTDAQYITAFETHLLTERRVARNTFEAYQSDINQFMTYLADKEETLVSASVPDLKGFVRQMHKKGAKPRTMARKISAIKVLYTFLNDHHSCANTAESLILPKIEKNLPIYLTKDEVLVLLQTAQNDHSFKGQRNLVMLHALYASGMRVTELVSLRIDQLHFDTGFVTIYGKGGRHREVPLPMQICEMIQRYIKYVRPELLGAKDDGRTDVHLFPAGRRAKVAHITRQTFWTMLKDLLKLSGIAKQVSPHTLRHSLATHLLQAGADIRSLQLWLGHEQMSTVEIYTHLEKSKVRKEYDKKHPRA